MNKKNEATYICDECSIEIVGIKAYYILQHKRANEDRKGFCSKACSNKFNTQERVFLICKTCGKSIKRLKSRIVGEVFCSSTCAARYNNVKRYLDSDKKICDAIINGRSFVKKINCKNCSKEFSGNCEQKYCSRKCQHEYESSEYIREWQAGFNSGGSIEFSAEISKYVRNYIFIKFENKCTRCGWSEINLKTGRAPLQIDHIDGNPYNHKEDNLTLLCPNCHSLTPTYGSLNRGKGRKDRRR